ncbi:hypothetical protein ASPZODRAFT_77757 [Penicilliopsis zonata CBS 506.65]|uniref:FAD dependent oxidoreductase domain-containing protein n=1 Tax=Penicilliopsis zonata CBS 506.65 TaxID=1073090 RepID=A0A1L9S4J7_9EURO|nr:hypothetical protein ASPZODRAFT_77757 [Penicilliopsis zonata CBS 506.65]OJJ42090.1 hypothetical protein ASPZODRAFT_77757 [Penicilliopsis zonata CBS 506.65]
MSLPHPQGMSSFWRKDPLPLDNHRSTPHLPAESDLVIVGGGYSAGALVTHILAEYPDHPSILVLEARQLCSGATGRNGGHLKPDPYSHAGALANEHGLAAGQEVAAFENANLVAVKKYIEQENVDCDLVVTRGCDVHFKEEQVAQAKKALQMMNSGDAFQTCKNVEQVSGVKNARGCVTFTAGHLWPSKLIHHMFRQAIAQGVNVQTHTSVQSLTRLPDGRWSLLTSRGTVIARQVVMATNAYTAALLPEYHEQIIPYRAVSCRIVTPGKAPLLTNTYSLRFTDWDFDYLIPRPDGSIIVGGARSAYCQKKDAWYGNADDSGVIEETRRYFDGYMQRHFIGWEESNAHVDDIWTGIMGYSRDKLPRIGPIPHRDGLFIMAGWTGHGMPQIFLAAKGMAEMVVGGKPYSQTGLPRLFEETPDRMKAPNKVLEGWSKAKL